MKLGPLGEETLMLSPSGDGLGVMWGRRRARNYRRRSGSQKCHGVGRSGHLLVSLNSQEHGLGRSGGCEMSEH